MKVLSANVGDLVGAVDGPGQNPKDNIFVVKEKTTNRWGDHLIVENSTGRVESVHSFTTVGIGWYYLGAAG